MVSHSRTHDKTDFKCSICEATFGTKGGLNSHMNTRHFDVPFEGAKKCDICDKYMTSHALAIHKRSRHGESPKSQDRPSCRFCGVTRRSLAEVKRHEEDVHADDTYKCFVCHVPYSKESAFRFHLRKAHPNLEHDIVKCENCPKLRIRNFAKKSILSYC